MTMINDNEIIQNVNHWSICKHKTRNPNPNPNPIEYGN